jgi:ribonuclease G
MFGWRKKGGVKREIIINVTGMETRVAVLENGRIEEYQVEHPSDRRIAGSVYKGKIQNLEHDLQAAFVDIGLAKNAFLHYWDMVPDDETAGADLDAARSGGRGRRKRRASPKKKMGNKEVESNFPAGSDLVVQVTKGAIGTKGPRVTAAVSLSGRYLVLMPGSTLKGVSRKIEDVKERQRLKKILEKMPLPNDMGVIVRTAAAGARKSSFVRDLRGLLAIWEEVSETVKTSKAPCRLYAEPDLVERVVRDWLTEDVDAIVIDEQETYNRIRDLTVKISRRARSKVSLHEGTLPLFDKYKITDQIDETFRRQVKLKSGGCLVFDETEALIAVDVNSGRHRGKGSQEEAILDINLEAVEEVARQLRLRNIGGLVVIDLIDMRSSKNQTAVFRAMKNALKRDRARTNVLPISDLGIMEMTRQRAEESLLSSMVVDCPYCRGRGSVKSPMSMSVEIQREILNLIRKGKAESQKRNLSVVVHPSVLKRLREEDEEMLVDLERELGGMLKFRSDPARHMEYMCIGNADTGEELYVSKDQV